jgi:hypothetical protein
MPRSDAQITHRIQITAGHPNSLSLDDLQDFVIAARQAGASGSDAVRVPPGQASGSALVYSLAVDVPVQPVADSERPTVRGRFIGLASGNTAEPDGPGS